MKVSTTEQFIIKANIIHDNKYDYSKSVYTTTNKKVCIICPESGHGEFWQTPNNHTHKIHKQGCPKCGLVKQGETLKRRVLEEKFKGVIQPQDHKVIPLTNGAVAMVDNEDFDKVKGISWVLMANDYACSSEGVYMHRFLLNPPVGMVVDHINHNKRDNRRGNLRVCTYGENFQNSTHGKGTSQYRGVYWRKDRRKWCARLHLNGKTISLGCFEREVDAAIAYDNKCKELHGEFYTSNLNITIK